MAPTKKTKLLRSLYEKSELINVPIGIEHEISIFQEKKLENEDERDIYMSLEEIYACLERRLEETNRVIDEKY